MKDWLPRLHDVDPYMLSQCLTMANDSQSITADDNTNAKSAESDNANGTASLSIFSLSMKIFIVHSIWYLSYNILLI